MAVNYGASDPDADARIQAEIKAEEDAIEKVCKDRGLVMHEVDAYSVPL